MSELPPDPFDPQEEEVIRKDVLRRNNTQLVATRYRDMFFVDGEPIEGSGYDAETLETLRVRLDALDAAIALADSTGLDVQLATADELRRVFEIFQQGYTE